MKILKKKKKLGGRNFKNKNVVKSFESRQKKKKEKKREGVFKEMLACFSRKIFQVWIQRMKDLRCANNVIRLKEKHLSRKVNMAHAIPKFTYKKS